MKMTMHIDEALLTRVMEHLGVSNKTLAVNLALAEMERKGKITKLAAKRTKLTPDEVKNIFDPDYDLEAMRAAEKPSTRYGKTRPRR